MKRAGSIVVGFAAFAMTAGAAMAADIPVVAPLAPPPPPAPVAAFDWAGPYVGADAGLFFWGAPVHVGLHGGYNIVNGNVLYGVDARASLVGFSSLIEAMVRARAGYLIGERLLVFAAAGVGWPGGPAVGFELGGGAEFALGQSLSLRAEVFQVFLTTGPIYPTFWTVGLTFHPGN